MTYCIENDDSKLREENDLNQCIICEREENLIYFKDQGLCDECLSYIKTQKIK